MTLPEDSSTEVEWTEPPYETIGAKGVPVDLPLPFGFGAATTGGRKGDVLHVRKSGDDPDSPEEGTLRWAVGVEGPTWIVFEKDLHIELHAALDLNSDTTVDGRGYAVDLAGAVPCHGLRIEQVENVIVTNLALHDFGDPTATGSSNPPHDAVSMNGARKVWLDHLDLARCSDKAVAISLGSTEVSVTACRFHDQAQTFQIGNMTNAEHDVNQTVTAAWNHFDHCGLRQPVVSYGKVHCLNNFVDSWDQYGIRSQRIAQAYVEGTVFYCTKYNSKATTIQPANDGANDSGTLEDDREGWLYDDSNLYLGEKCKKQSTGTEHMFDPHEAYAYPVRPASEALAGLIVGRAGPR